MYGMKTIAALVIGGALLAAPLMAEVKIGYIDSARIFAEYKGTADAQRTFDEEVVTWEAQAQTMKVELDSLDQEYERQSLMMSDAKKAERQQQILQKRQEYESFVQSVWGPQGRLATKNSELVAPIVEKINIILEKLGEEEGYTLVLDASVGGIVYATDGIDLTTQVLEELNEGVQ